MEYGSTPHHHHPKAQTSMAYTNSLPPLPTPRSMSVASKATASHPRHASSVMHRTPVEHVALNDAPFLTKDKVRALEQFAIMAGPRRPVAAAGAQHSYRRKHVPLPVTVVGMQSSVVTTTSPYPPKLSTPGIASPAAFIHPDVHEAIIADTVARLANVFQHRLHEHAIAATVRHFTQDLVELSETARSSRPQTLVEHRWPDTARLSRPQDDPQDSSSSPFRALTPRHVWHTLNEEGGTLHKKTLVPIQPNASSTTPLNHRMVPTDPRHDMKNHPALVAPWCSSSNAAVVPKAHRELHPMPPPPLAPISATLASMPSLEDNAAPWHVPMAEEALSRILTHHKDNADATARAAACMPVAAPPTAVTTNTAPDGRGVPRVVSTPPPHKVVACHDVRTPQPTLHRPDVAVAAAPSSSFPVCAPEHTRDVRSTKTGPPSEPLAAKQPNDTRQQAAAEAQSGALLGSDALAAAMAAFYEKDETLLPHQRAHRGGALATPKRNLLHPGSAAAATDGGRVSPRLSEAMDHIVFAEGRWSVSQQSARPTVGPARTLSGGGPRPTSSDMPVGSTTDITSLGSRGSDGALPVLLVASGTLNSFADDALRATVSQQGPRPGVAGQQGNVPPRLNTASAAMGTRPGLSAVADAGNRKSPLVDALPRSPFPQSARIAVTEWASVASTQLQSGPLSPRHAQQRQNEKSAAGGGWEKSAKHQPHRTSNSPPTSPNTLCAHRDALVMSPSVEPKPLHPADPAAAAGRGAQQTAIAHDPSILLRFDESYTSDLGESDAVDGTNAKSPASKKQKKDAVVKSPAHRRHDSTDGAPRPATKERVTSGGGSQIPARVQQLVPLPLSADIRPISEALGPRLLSADQPTLEAQVERDVIRGEYDSILAPSRDTKATVDASVTLLQEVVGVKLRFRDDLVKKYEALQQVKRSHADVMQAISAMHSCLAAGKASTDNISLETLLAGIDALSTAPSAAAAAAASHAAVAGAAAAPAMSRVKSVALSRGSKKPNAKAGKAKTKSGGPDPARDSAGDSDDASSSASDSSATAGGTTAHPKREASRGVAKKTTTKRGGKGGRPTGPPDYGDEVDASASAAKGGPTTADLLREAQRARLAQPAVQPVAAGTAINGTLGDRRQPPRSVGGTDQSNASDGAIERFSAAELQLKKSLAKATASFDDAKQRYERAHLFMVNRGRGLLKSRNNPQQASGTGAAATTGKSPKSTTKRVPAALEAKLAVMSTTAGLTPAEEKEAITAAISDELQAEFRDINARRDTQRNLAETQERELDDVRQDMKRLTSAGNNAAARDEAAATMTALVQRRDQQQRMLHEEGASATSSVPAPAAAAATAAGGGASFDDDEDMMLARSPDLVEMKNAAVQAEEGAQGQQKHMSPEQTSQMGDLYRLEQRLLSSVRRLIVAVAHVMMFHRSIEIELTCKGCLTLFRGPRTLWPCGHVFCQACLIAMYGDSNDMITCGDCGTLTDIGFTPDPVLQDLAFYQGQYKHQGHFALHSDDGEGGSDVDEEAEANNKPKTVSFDYGTSAGGGAASSTNAKRKNNNNKHTAQSNSPTKGSLQDVLEELLSDLVGAEEQSTGVSGSFDSTGAASRSSSR